MELKDELSAQSITQEQSQPSNRIILRSEDDTIVLKQLITDDAERYFQLVDSDRAHLSQHGDKTAQKYPTVEAVRKSIIPPENNPKKFRFGIWDGNVMVGSNNLTPVVNNRAELGSWIAKSHTGHRYAARARKLLVNFAFNRLGLDEVFSEIVIGNEASRKSVERSGFIFAGEKEGKWIYILKHPKGKNV